MTGHDEPRPNSAWWAKWDTVDPAELEEIDLWFDAFARQSAHPSLLGDGRRWGKVFDAGRSGAGAALFQTETGLIVLKWDELAKVTVEAETRQALPDQADALHVLRDRGASHIAVRVHGHARKSVYGVIAYRYLGPGPDADASAATDLETLLREWFLVEGQIGDSQLRRIFRELIGRFEPSETRQDGVTTAATIKALPDLKRDTYLAHARRVLNARGLPTAVLDSVKSWWTKMAELKVGHSDSRVVHGDPRFANIMVNLDDHEHSATLIDFGAGGRGRHVFHDLARFEVDMVFRLGPVVDVGDRDTDIYDRLNALLALGQPVNQGPRNLALRPAEIWRDIRDNRWVAIAVKPHDRVRELYAVFLVNELLRRLKWHQEGHGDSGAGATISEIVHAIRVVMLTVPVPGGELAALPIPDDELALVALLSAAGCDTATWGGQKSKTVGHLLAELRDADCELFVDDAGLGRRVRNVWVEVFAPAGDGRRLIERVQVFTEGGELPRPLPASLGEKAKRGEVAQEAARRGLMEELGLGVDSYELSAGQPRENPIGRDSYPGLRTVYETHWFVARLYPVAFKPDGYVETQPDKQTYFEWEAVAEQEPTSTRSRRSAVEPAIRIVCSGGKFSTFVESDRSLRIRSLGSTRGAVLNFVPQSGAAVALAADAAVLALPTLGQIAMGWLAPTRAGDLAIAGLVTLPLPERFERARTLAIREAGHVIEFIVADEALGTFTLSVARRSWSWLDPVRIGRAAFRAAVATSLGVAAIDGEGHFVDVDGRFGHPFDAIVRLNGFDCVETPSGLVALGWGTSTDGASLTLVAKHTPDGWTDGVELDHPAGVIGLSLVRSLDSEPVVVAYSPTGSIVMEI